MKLFIVGGFLGSGKTTAISQAVLQLNSKKKVSVITNDQGSHLVDTQFFKNQKILVEEVRNGCFCCNFSDLENSIQNLRKTYRPAIIFAETVGTCTDVVATVIKPLINKYPGKLDLVYSVFADVQLLLTHLKERENIFNKNVNYIYGKQLEEADIIVINKIDLLDKKHLQNVKGLIYSKYKDKLILFQNSWDRVNIEKWVAECDSFKNISRSSLNLDYEFYGDGESLMGWLNEEIGIATTASNALSVGYELINVIYDKIAQEQYQIGHLKFIITDGMTARKISFTTFNNNKSPQPRMKSNTNRVIIIVNARVQTQANNLKQIITEAIVELEASMACKIIQSKLEAFQPAYPNPTHRISV